MNKFFRELRRREVFRATGLYVGVVWILIEVASVLFDAFEAPDWALQAIIILAVIGFPVTVVLAWVYDITESGIQVQADPTDTIVVPFGGRRTDFLVIGVLTVALVFSVYLNIVSGPKVVEELEPISVLIADFDNTTGDELFQGTLEEALHIGIEGAPFITTYQRSAARQIAADDIAGGLLDEAAARLVAVREDIGLVLAGRIEEDDGRYEFAIRAIEPQEGSTVAEADSEAKNKLEVLAAIGDLAGDLRKELGDKSLEQERMPAKETFSAASLEAAKNYVTAQELSDRNQSLESIEYYRKAVELDPEFGRAYVSWALSSFNLGRTDEAEQLWEQAFALLDTMTERERLRTLGLYYSMVTRNYVKSIETYQQLVAKYPADDAAHNNLAVLHFFTLDFDAALEAGGKVLEIYPNVAIYRGNRALYTMYAGNFESAVSEMLELLETDSEYFKGWLPIAMNALDQGNIDGARDAYRSMAKSAADGVATADLGLADAEIFAGNFSAARNLVEPGIEQTLTGGSQYVAAASYIAVADSLVAEGRFADAAKAADKALEVSRSEPWVVSAALAYISAGRLEDAHTIAVELTSQIQPQSRAYGLMIAGLIASANGDHVAAIGSMTEALELADLWLVRFSLGKAYLAAGYNAEALDEFMTCKERHGEATSIYLDDLPTYRMMVPLSYWLGVVQGELGMQSASAETLQSFLDLRANGGALVEDATRRLR